MKRKPVNSAFLCKDDLGCGMSKTLLTEGVQFVYSTLDKLDATLLEAGSPRITGLVELANLSSILGNLLATGIVKAGSAVFTRASPHKYQDLRAINTECHANVEIKVALEKNNPKGHLAKAGHYLTCRYVLGNVDGTYTIGQRGDVVWIWELRFGHLEKRHFNISNTAGDSGKTAMVNAAGMDQLEIAYFDPRYSPYTSRSSYIKRLTLLANCVRKRPT